MQTCVSVAAETAPAPMVSAADDITTFIAGSGIVTDTRPAFYRIKNPSRAVETVNSSAEHQPKPSDLADLKRAAATRRGAPC